MASLMRSFYLLILLFFYGCAQQESVRVKRLTTEAYSPSRYVEILNKAPKRRYLKIAELDIRGAEGSPKTELVGALSQKARELGAEALILEDRSVPIGNPFIMNTSGGMYDTNLNRYIPAYHAVAIRYMEE
ncbi:hypothetical protein [Candidatus Methylacidiphilum infernorum]|uniref:Lipoprotein n=1 Tax=Methylacidiphilum infernorum (isolate V4) TaxID=481448 RepID=B3DZ40_METI4|nr:hypothetical protein [Candidatus Methylacidiphilum infernorum]ACD84132.1 Conserved hypothetical protein [Methylacidiphilum infernorum V4]